MHLAVTCKNHEFHFENNPFHGYRITVPNRPDKPFKVTCDQCGKTYSYDPQDVLDMAD